MDPDDILSDLVEDKDKVRSFSVSGLGELTHIHMKPYFIGFNKKGPVCIWTSRNVKHPAEESVNGTNMLISSFLSTQEREKKISHLYPFNWNIPFQEYIFL